MTCIIRWQLKMSMLSFSFLFFSLMRRGNWNYWQAGKYAGVWEKFFESSLFSTNTVTVIKNFAVIKTFLHERWNEIEIRLMHWSSLGLMTSFAFALLLCQVFPYFLNQISLVRSTKHQEQSFSLARPWHWSLTHTFQLLLTYWFKEVHMKCWVESRAPLKVILLILQKSWRARVSLEARIYYSEFV